MPELERRMAAATEDGVDFDALGPELKVGDKAPDATLRWFSHDTSHIEEVVLSEVFAQGDTILHVVNSGFTSVCEGGVEHIEELRDQSKLPEEVSVLTISNDLPFGLDSLADSKVDDQEHHKLVSAHLSDFGMRYGALLTGKGDLDGLLMRLVVVIRKGIIVSVNYVKDQGNYNDSQAAIEEAVKTVRAEMTEA